MCIKYNRCYCWGPLVKVDIVNVEETLTYKTQNTLLYMVSVYQFNSFISAHSFLASQPTYLHFPILDPSVLLTFLLFYAKLSNMLFSLPSTGRDLPLAVIIMFWQNSSNSLHQFLIVNRPAIINLAVWLVKGKKIGKKEKELGGGMEKEESFPNFSFQR